MEGKTIIEVNGIKLEVDLRTARRIDELRIGDRVKVLRSDIKTYGMTKAGIRARLNGPLDEQMDYCLKYENRFNQTLTCIDAKAMA